MSHRSGRMLIHRNASRKLAPAMLGLLLAAMLAPAAAEEILRPRDKVAFEAELKALQEKYGKAPDSMGSGTVEPVPVSASASAPEPAESALAASESADQARAADAAEPASAAAVGKAADPAAPSAPVPSAVPASEDRPVLQFSGTVLKPRRGELANESKTDESIVAAAATPIAPSQSALPVRKLSDPDANRRNAEELVDAPALRVTLLPVGQRQFLLREQIYDAESLEIYLRQLNQSIDSVILLSEPDHPIEIGHLVALGRLGRALRVPTMYQQGGNLRALSVR